MEDKDKTREQLSSELAEMRQRVVDLQERLGLLETVETERDLAEAALQRAQREVDVMAARVEEADAELGDFVYQIYHDLCLPVSMIGGYSRMLLKNHKGILSDEGVILGFVNTINRSAKRMDAMLAGLSQFARINRSNLQIETMDIGELLRKLVALLDLPANVEVVMQDDWPTIKVDAYLLRQVFENLIDNAVKFNRSPHKRVELGWRVLDEHYELFVRDNGIGVDPDYHSDMFILFGLCSYEYEGVGVGLAVVKKAINRLGGSIRMESELDEGSTFFVTLPKIQLRSGEPAQRAAIANTSFEQCLEECLAEIKAASQGDSGPAITELTRPAQILVIEDDSNWLEFLARQLQSPQLVIHETRKATEAIELVQKNSYDLLLLDWHIPGGGGRGILQALRDVKVDVPTVVMSGYRDVEHRTQALQLGARAFIEKPRDEQHWAALKRAILGAVTSLDGLM